jgi:hypothetical protein
VGARDGYRVALVRVERIDREGSAANGDDAIASDR